MAKVDKLNVSAHVKNWIAAFLSSRSQATKITPAVSTVLPTNLGVVQGSVLGPTLFTIMVSDLKPQGDDNDMCKYADDVTLLVPENSDTGIGEEFEAIKLWAAANKLIINASKTKELVFHRPRPAKPLLPPPLDGIERLTVAKLLGVHIDDTLCFSTHITHVLSACSQRMFLLRKLRVRGLPAAQLQTVFTALILSKILYAVSAWGGFISAADQKRIDATFDKCRRYGFCTSKYSFWELLINADHKLFCKAKNSAHCLNRLMPPVRATVDTLRERGHPYTLPTCRRELYKQSFIVRNLFSFM
jgi:hypothetical protein